jgi:ferritin-like metal-binding protein YciE
MTDEQKKVYLAWLSDAHAMELGLVTVLEKQAKDTEDSPELHSKIADHLEKTKVHAQKVEDCLTRLGGDPSTGKDWLSKMGAAAQGVASSMPADALVKNIHADYASEHFEIATYTLLASAADELGDAETATVCRDILADEEDMAAWLLTTLKKVGAKHLQSAA